MLYQVLENLDQVDKFYYTGITLLARIPFASPNLEDKENAFIKYGIDKELFDFEKKSTKVVSDTFFKNIQISNYRDYKGDVMNPTNPFLVNFSRATLSESGIQYVIDINDRYKYVDSGNNYELDVLKIRIDSNIMKVFEELGSIRNDNL
jgi:hypothetical protein